MECLQCKGMGRGGVEMIEDGRCLICPFGHQELAPRENLREPSPKEPSIDEQNLKIMMDVSMMMAAWSLFKTMTNDELDDFWEMAHKRLVQNQGLSSKKVGKFINAMKKSQQDMRIYFQSDN